MFLRTLREDPADADVVSDKLLQRACYLRKAAPGIWTWLPLGLNVLNKIENIIREEMASIDAQEVHFSGLLPREPYEATHRWEEYGDNIFRLKDRHEADYLLAPTHEEMFTLLVKDLYSSYKDLPVTLYQIQTKYRDEFRPRAGLIRGREFIMKDAYSFSATQESLQEEYDKMKQAYANICERCYIKALPVVADSGEIGGDTSVEYMALADAGEASLVYCDDCGFAADDEAASTKVVVAEGPGDGKLTKVETPGMGTIEAVAKFFGFPENGTRKSLALIDAEGKPVVAIVPGDHELNDCKAEHVFGKGYRMMTDEELQTYGLHKGFIGPVNLPEGIRLVCDESLRESKQWACGANEVDYHFTGACPERDFTVDEWADLVTVVAGDPCPHCGKPLSAARGIEVSQVFQLGTKYSEAMGATFMDEDGKEKPLIMGCYGVGVSRSLAAVVEQHNDEHGIVWPVSVAPYEVAVIPLDPKKEECATVCEQIVDGLCAEGIEVVVDDRDERPGFKFADNDLMGFPYQVVLGKRGLKSGTVELKDRASGEREDVAIDEVVAKVSKLVKAARR